MKKLNIPSPDELIQKARETTTPLQQAMAESLTEILTNKFSWASISVTLKAILRWANKKMEWKRREPEEEDRNKLEQLMSEAWWGMNYDGPAYNEDPYDSYYKVGKKK